MKRFSGALFLSGAFILAGTSVVAARLVGPGLGPFTISAVSLLVALPALLVACGGRVAGRVRRMVLRDWLFVLMQALFGVFLFRLFLLKGLALTSSAEAGILTGATPAATALLACVLLKEPMGRARALGVACTVAGILVLQGLLLPGGGFAPVHLAGNLLVLLAALSESVFNILSRASMLRTAGGGGQGDAVVQTTLVSAAALLLCAIPAYLERPVPSLLSLSATGWMALLWYGLFITAFAYIFWYSGIRRSEAGMAAAFSGMMPLTALLLSALLLGERPGWQQWAGGGLVVAGMLLSGGKAAYEKRSKLRMRSESETQSGEFD